MYRNVYSQQRRHGSPATAAANSDRGTPKSASPGTASTTNESSDKTFSLYPMSVDEQLRTIFIGSIPKGLSDTIMMTALKQLPGLNQWVRIYLPSGEPSTFGFARFATPGAVHVALTVVPKLTIKGRDSGLVARAEENTLRWIESQGTISIQAIARRSEDQLVQSLNMSLSLWTGETEYKTKANDNENGGDVDSASSAPNNNTIDNDEEFADIPPEDREIIKQEVKEFRELSVKLEKQRLAEDEQYEQQTQQRFAKVTAEALARKQTESSYGLDMDELNFSDENEYADEPDDWAIESARQEKENKRKDREFMDIQRRWRSREKTRASAFERENVRDDSKEESRLREKEKQLKKLEAFNDEDDYIRKHYKYYYDHPTWVKERMIDRKREIEWEEQDARDEQQEIEEAQRANPSALPRQTGKISLSIGKRQGPSVTTTQPSARPKSGPTDLMEEEEESKLSRRPLVSSLNNLDSEIPPLSAKDALFEWPLKWSALDEFILDGEIIPFVTNNIIEYLGVQEDELIDFVVQHVKDNKPPQELVSELEMTLDEDAEIFTAKLWRKLIFETERKSRNI